MFLVFIKWSIGHSPIKGEGKDIAIHVNFKSIKTPEKVWLMCENGREDTSGDDNAEGGQVYLNK